MIKTTNCSQRFGVTAEKSKEFLATGAEIYYGSLSDGVKDHH